MQSFAKYILRHAGLIALLGLLTGGAGLYFSAQLFKNLRTDLEELLPTSARSVVDLDEVTRRLQSIDNLAILVFSDHPEASRRFVEDLANRLEKLPPTTISSVEYRIDREIQFFRDRAALYMDLSDLKRIEAYVGDRIEYEKDLYNPLNIFRTDPIPEPMLDFHGLRLKYGAKTSSYDRFPGGYYATPDGRKRVILAYMPGKTSSISQVKLLKSSVESAVAALNPSSYSPDIRIFYTGGVQDTLEEQSALVEDLISSTVIVTILVTLAMLLFFRNIRATIALTGSVFIGTFWTFGIAYPIVGYLNANSAFLGSIVIGNGINFGIITLARYLEDRRNGLDNASSIQTALCQTATSTWTAAGAAALAYGSLILTGFRGFRQFGVIGLIGMVLCWISAFTLLPAFLTVMDRRKSLTKPGEKQPPSHLACWVATLVSRFPKLIAGLATVAVLVSLSTLGRYSPAIIETDLSKLRNKDSMEKGSGYLSHYLDEIFNRYLAPLVMLPHSRENALKIEARLKEIKKEEGASSLIASVQSMEDFIPKDQPQKIEALKGIQALLPQRILTRLSPEDREKIRDLLNPASFKPLGLNDLPELVINKFTEKDGSVGKLVLVEPPLSNATWAGDKLIRFIRELRETGDAIEPHTAVAGALPIVSDMIEAISEDGPKATFFAFLAVVLLVIALFRNVRTIAQILLALFMGVIWLAGIILGFGLKINFLNFIALPITFGIGVDYGVNIFQRYRQEGPGKILTVIRNTGGAVGLCSFTTIVGYSSLLIAGNQGFVSFGRLAVAGELTCVAAAVIALPAFLMLLDRARSPD